MSVTFASAIVIENFENFPVEDFWQADLADRTGTFFTYNANFATLQIVDNPNKSGINTSDKVCRVQVWNGGPNSGIVKINFSGITEPVVTYPACPTCTNEKFDRLRFKYYKGSLLDRYVEFEPYGSPTNPATRIQAQGMDEWEYITIELTSTTYTDIQLRVNRGETGGSSPSTAEGDFIYVDDFEFFNVTDGPDFPPSTAIQSIAAEKAFSCVSSGENKFRLDADLENPANVRIELIAMDGRSEVLYDHVAEGKLEVPFSVKNRGIYCMRAIIDNQVRETVKIVY